LQAGCPARASEKGANAYVTKPFDAHDLQTTVRSLLNYSGA